MAKLTRKKAHEIIEYNIQRVYHMPSKYNGITHYLQGNVRRTLLQILNYLKDKQIIIDYDFDPKGQYLFFMDNSRLTGIVRRSNDRTSSARYMNILCTMGFFTKQKQIKNDERLILANINFFEDHPERKRAINVYAIHKLTNKELKRINERSERMKTVGVRINNISYNMLMSNQLEDLAKEVFPANNQLAPERKMAEFEVMKQCIDMLIESNGYASRQQIIDNLTGSMSEQEIDRLLRIFRNELQKLYNFKRPTKAQKAAFSLTNSKFIYTRAT